MDDTKNYKRWAISQRMQELMKALKRKSSRARELELEALKRDLDES